MKDLLLGIDVGTTGTKCTIYDFQGQAAASAYTEYPMLRPHPLWAEQEPAKWWEAVCRNLRDCFDRQGIDSARLAAAGISCTNAVVLVDRQGEALCNAIGLHDTRSGDQLSELKSVLSSDFVLQRTGNRLDKGSFALPRLKWLQQCMPDVIENSYKFLTPGGYIIQHLTGNFIINHSRANLTLMADVNTGEWAYDIIHASGFPERLLPKSLPTCSVAGTVTKKAAELTGLPEGLPVSAGAVDTVQATFAAGATDPGDVALTVGSSGRICYVSDMPIIDRRLLNCESPISGHWTVIQTTNNAGVSLKWFRDTFGEAVRGKAQANDRSIYGQLDIEAASIEPRSDSVLFLPYLSGEQSPIWNAGAKGVFFNIGLGSGYGDFARAIMEGVAFSIRDCLDIVLQKGVKPSIIPAGGGVANSEFWCQVFADILGYPIAKLSQPETETLGDAITAAMSVGIKEVDPKLGKTLMQSSRIFYPNDRYTAIYDELFEKYKQLYGSVQNIFS